MELGRLWSGTGKTRLTFRALPTKRKTPFEHTSRGQVSGEAPSTVAKFSAELSIAMPRSAPQ